MQYKLPPVCSIDGVSDVWRSSGVGVCSILFSNSRVVSLSAIVTGRCSFALGVILRFTTNFFFFFGCGTGDGSSGVAGSGAGVGCGACVGVGAIGAGVGASRFAFHFANPVDLAMLNDEPNFSIATFITKR